MNSAAESLGPATDRGCRRLSRPCHGVPAARVRVLQAAIHATWCGRASLADPAPWPQVLRLYDAMLLERDDPIVRLKRAVALAEVAGVATALAEVNALDAAVFAGFPPYHAVRADLLNRDGRIDEARAAYEAALALVPAPAERLWLERRRDSLSDRDARRS